jgi:hypothetical protein
VQTSTLFIADQTSALSRRYLSSSLPWKARFSALTE